MIKRLLPLLCTAVLLLCLLASCALPPAGPSTPSAEDKDAQGLSYTLLEDDTYAVSIGDATALAEITIPATYKDKPVTEIAASGFASATALKKVSVSGNVLTTVGASAFRGCTLLSEIRLPDSVVYIGDRAFYNCQALTAASLGAGVRALGEYAFYGCKTLSQIALPTALQRIDKGAFYNCKALEGIAVPAGVESIGASAFEGCSALQSISLPFIGWDKNANNGAHLGYIFGTLGAESVPESLKTVALAGCTSIPASAFEGCDGLTAISIPATLTEVGEGAFSGCSSIERVYIDDIAAWCAIRFASADANPLSIAGELILGTQPITGTLQIPAAVTRIGDFAFYGFTALTGVSFPATLQSVGFDAFAGCTALESASAPSLAAWCAIRFASADANPAAIAGCLLLGGTEVQGALTVSATIPQIGDYAFYGLTGITSLVIESGVGTVGHSAFENCTALNSVVVADGVSAIGFSAFGGCTALASLTVPFTGEKRGNAGATHLGYIFGSQSPEGSRTAVPASLKSVTLTADAVEYSAFYECENLKSIFLTGEVRSIGNHAFAACSSLSSILLPETVESIGSFAFLYCSSLGSIVIPDATRSMGESCFNTCTALTSVSIGRELREIEAETFSDCVLLATLTFAPDAKLSLIGQNAFYACESLTQLHLPENLIEIGEFAFHGCVGLTAVALPESVEILQKAVFDQCKSLASVTLGSRVRVFGDNMFNGCDSMTYTRDGLAIYVGSEANPYLVLVRVSNSRWSFAYDIRESTKTIANGAFDDCVKLNRVSIPAGVTAIPSHAFSSCISLQSVVIPEGVKTIGYAAFEGCTSLASVTLPGTLTEIGQFAFDSCTSLASVTVPDSVQTIGDCAFFKCGALTELVLGAGVTFIGDTAFGECGLERVFYGGASAAIWNAIDIGVNNNEKLRFADRYYYSELAPSSEGKYWHYNEDGVVYVWDN